MLIECQKPRPVPPISLPTEKAKRNRITLSEICNNFSDYAHQLPESSRITSPANSSTSREQTSSPVSLVCRSLQSPSSSMDPHTSAALNTEQFLPSFSHLQFPSSQNNSASKLSNPEPQFPSHYRRPPNNCLDHLTSPIAPQSRYRLHPCSIPSTSTLTDSPFTTGTSRLPYLTKHNSSASMEARTSTDRLLPHPFDNSRTSPVSPASKVPQTVSSHSRRRYSSQTSSRTCTNCSISQTRQWVRGENHAWLCHSCGQFWRKNGYPRPRALWNRPTFKRSSRKSRLVSQDDGSRKMKGSTRQSVSSSFLDGKKMIQWEIRLPPLQSAADNRDLTEARTRLTSRVRDSVEHTSGMLPGDTGNSSLAKFRPWRSLPTVL